jgi:Uma2 family endonuclease
MPEAFMLADLMTVAGFDDFLVAQSDDIFWELIDGRLFPMTEPTVDHAEIASNIGAALLAVMPADRRWRVARGGLRVHASDDRRATFALRPDVMVWAARKTVPGRSLPRR